MFLLHQQLWLRSLWVNHLNCNCCSGGYAGQFEVVSERKHFQLKSSRFSFLNKSFTVKINFLSALQISILNFSRLPNFLACFLCISRVIYVSDDAYGCFSFPNKASTFSFLCKSKHIFENPISLLIIILFIKFFFHTHYTEPKTKTMSHSHIRKCSPKHFIYQKIEMRNSQRIGSTFKRNIFFRDKTEFLQDVLHL